MNLFADALLRDPVSSRFFRQQPHGLHISRPGFLGGLNLSLRYFLQGLGSGADLHCVGGP
jgi:hypothetical protein